MPRPSSSTIHITGAIAPFRWAAPVTLEWRCYRFRLCGTTKILNLHSILLYGCVSNYHGSSGKAHSIPLSAASFSMNAGAYTRDSKSAMVAVLGAQWSPGVSSRARRHIHTTNNAATISESAQRATGVPTRVLFQILSR
jgi:hypothetical protein